MSAIILDGRAIAGRIQNDIADRVTSLRNHHNSIPGLATVLVGDNPASKMYVKMKRNRCADVGITSFYHELPVDVPQQELLDLITQLNEDDTVHGILIQLPLPEHIDVNAVLSHIAPHKDVDGFNPINLGGLAMPHGMPEFVPATQKGVVVMLREAERLVEGFELQGADTLVIGAGNIGLSLSLLLLETNATVTVAHTFSKNIPDMVRRADVVIGAAGAPELVKGDWFKPGAIAVDVGIVKVPDATRKKGYRWVGDFEFETAKERVAAISPVPGGVGPMTIAMLLQNTLHAVELSIEKNPVA